LTTDDVDIGEDGRGTTTVIDDDDNDDVRRGTVQDAVCAAFNSAAMYAETFDVFLEFYRDNESLDLQQMRTEEHGRLYR